MKGKLIQNKYFVLRTLGKDQFSETFLAKDRSKFSFRRYVIKKFRPILGNPYAEGMRLLFNQEATILKRLSGVNPQIPRLYECFMDGEDFYLVREWINGITLEQKVQSEGVICEAEAKQILDSILRVLKYIHSYNIVYRQLKPSSILLRKQNWLHQGKKQDYLPVPIYFGGVKELAKKPEKFYQESFALANQKEYISPEQEKGQSVYASDLYSLGLTIIYSLTGKTPAELNHSSFSNKLLWQHEAPNLKTNLARVIERAICPRTQDRFTSAEEMLQALHAQPVLITRSFDDRLTKKSSLTPEIKLVSLLFFLSLGIIGIIFGLSNFSLPQLLARDKLDDSSATTERMKTMSGGFKTSSPIKLIDGLNIPIFPVGTDRQKIFSFLGNPSIETQGYWENSKAFSYFDFAPNQVALGYLADEKTQKVRQTEMTFNDSVDLATIQQAVQELLLENYSPDVEHKINQVFFKTSAENQFESKNLAGIVQRNEDNGIYIGIWDKNFH